MGNLPSKFGHTRPLGYRIIRCVRDGRTDGRTKSNAYCPFPTGGGIITVLQSCLFALFSFSSSDMAVVYYLADRSFKYASPRLESTSRFIPSASPFLSRFTSSSTCQPVSLIVPTLIIHHFFTLSLQAQNLPFQQILSTLDSFIYWTASW